MPMRIEKISLKKCGPISDFSFELSDLNLIYSENEKGKSFLVEFLIHSLFKNKKQWEGLREAGEGKVIISGADSKILEFYPTEKRGKKLEDFLEKQQKGLPPSLCNLLIVKEGETRIVKNAHGIDKNTFKQILSPRLVLDEIDKNISDTIKKTTLSDGQINIINRGEGKDYNELKEKIRKIEELFSLIVNVYEQGELKDLEIKKEKLLLEKQLLLKAKRYQAFMMSEQLEKQKQKKEKFSDELIKLKSLIDEYEKLTEHIERLNNEISQLKRDTQRLPELIHKREQLLKAKRYEASLIGSEMKKIEEHPLFKLSEDDISKIQTDLVKYADKLSEREEKIKISNQLKEKSKDYLWLQKAKENYNRWLSSDLESRNAISFAPFISGFLLVVGILLIFFEHKLPGIFLLTVSTLIIFYYFFKFKSLLVKSREKVEIKNLQDEFFNRFGIELKTLTDLEAILMEQDKNFHNLETSERDIERLTIELNLIKGRVEEAFLRMGFGGIEEEQWREKYLQIKKERKFLEDKYRELKNNLEKLEIDPWEYEPTDPGIKFSKEKFELIKQEITRFEELKRLEETKENEKIKAEEKLFEIKRKIKEFFEKNGQLNLEESEWVAEYKKLEEEKKQVEDDIKKIEGKLEGFGVQESEFEKENPGRAFSQQELERVEKELSEIQEQIKRKDEELSRLRDRIIQLTGIEISANWNEMIERVYSMRKDLYDDYEDCVAKIISGKLIHDTIKELNEQEDEKLLERINSTEIINLVEKLTGRYKSISFEQNDIIVTDEYSSFKISDLSTGAKEQLMIALRIGFVKSILKGKTAFLILDDAFQHSDYKKRPLLIDYLFELAKEGWQIIYLTMDDHIRDLFREKAKHRVVKFKEIYLNQDEYRKNNPPLFR